MSPLILRGGWGRSSLPLLVKVFKSRQRENAWQLNNALNNNPVLALLALPYFSGWPWASYITSLSLSFFICKWVYSCVLYRIFAPNTALAQRSPAENVSYLYYINRSIRDTLQYIKHSTVQ